MASFTVTINPENICEKYVNFKIIFYFLHQGLSRGPITNAVLKLYASTDWSGLTSEPKYFLKVATEALVLYFLCVRNDLSMMLGMKYTQFHWLQL